MARGSAAGSPASGSRYRPHVKTAKSIEVARRLMTGRRAGDGLDAAARPRVFAAAGCTDITYGVGIAPDKLGRVLALRRARRRPHRDPRQRRAGRGGRGGLDRRRCRSRR